MAHRDIAPFRFESLESRTLFAAGSLDPSFNGSGILEKGYRDTNDFVDVVTQKNGNIVAVGSTQTSGQGKDALIARFKPSGARDQSFGTGGVVIKNFNGDDVITAVAIQPDGKIVVAGTISSPSFSTMFVARYNTNGTPDTSFGAGGSGFNTPDTSFGAGGSGFNTIDFIVSSGATGIAIQSTGKIVVSGFAGNTNFRPGLALARLKTNGTLDTTFGRSGIVTTSAGGANLSAEFAGRMVRLKNDKLVFALTRMSLSSGSVAFGVARYTADGQVDTTFSDDGRAFVKFGNKVEVATSVAIDPVTKYVVVAGTTSNGLLQFGTDLPQGLSAYFTQATQADVAVARLKSNGGLDANFSGDGKRTVNFDSSATVRLDGATDVAVDASQRVYLTGATQPVGGLPKFAAARLLASGALDSAFSGDGKNAYSAGASDGSFGSYLTSGGHLWLAGHSKESGSNGHAVLMEILTA